MQSETKKPEGEQVWMNLEEFLLVKQRFLEIQKEKLESRTSVGGMICQKREDMCMWLLMERL